MFGEKNNDEKKKDKVETILGNGTHIKGDIHTNGSLRVEGEVTGNIEAEGDLFVGEEGKIKTEIKARNVVIAGRVEGDVIAYKKLEILPSGKLHGDIKTKTLKIEEGAVFNGSSVPLDENNKKKINGKKSNNKSNKSNKKDKTNKNINNK
jgi:cytoskeletal protein CcmA (bactofilin family)